jgi:hypothetical protein
VHEVVQQALADTWVTTECMADFQSSLKARLRGAKSGWLPNPGLCQGMFALGAGQVSGCLLDCAPARGLHWKKRSRKLHYPALWKEESVRRSGFSVGVAALEKTPQWYPSFFTWLAPRINTGGVENKTNVSRPGLTRRCCCCLMCLAITEVGLL